MCRARQHAEWDRTALLCSMWSEEPPSTFHPFMVDQPEKVDEYDPAVLEAIQNEGRFAY